jgi:hypothetical protein
MGASHLYTGAFHMGGDFREGVERDVANQVYPDHFPEVCCPELEMHPYSET